MSSIYILDNKYYQKLGEVWDHEVKDFKVLYKPLYNCENKKGSFEGHHLATTSFERWNRKFQSINSLNNETENHPLPDYIQEYLLSENSLEELTKGNNNLSNITKPMPTFIQSGSIIGQVVLNELSTHPLDSNLQICRSDSGYGSRSLLPYYVMDFDRKWKEPILQKTKTATTRILTSNIPGSEPYLQEIITQFYLLRNEGLTIQAICEIDSTSTLSEVIGKIHITNIQEFLVKDLSIELANLELFNTVESFILCLKEYYPTLSENDVVTVFYFNLVE